jgi:serine protease Do
MHVGDWVIAIGNPFGLASSVSAGIISARARDIHTGPYDEFLQTDAAINPGNSGGPLFSMSGEVIGINTAIVGGGTGIGFAVPSNIVKEFLPQLEKSGSVTRGYVGLFVQDLTPDLARGLGVPVTKGAVVSQAARGSPAEKAGLRQDDVIVAIDGEDLISGGALTRTVALKRPGTKAVMTIYRDGRRQDRVVLLAMRPDLEHASDKPAAAPPEEGAHDAQKREVGLMVSDMEAVAAQHEGLPATGALVTGVEPGSAADRAELQPGMEIIEAGGKPVRSARDFEQIAQGAKSGSILLVRVAVPGQASPLLRAVRMP